jgi:amino acid transporter
MDQVTSYQPPARSHQIDEALVRAIGVRRLTASIINVTIGAGIFVLPAVAAARLGPAAPLAYIVCAALMALIMTCIATAGSRVSLTGGLYAYVEVAFGPFVGFLAGVIYCLQCVFAAASVASAFVGSIGSVWPGAGVGVGRVLVLMLLFGVLAATNVRGVRHGAGLVELTTLAKLLPLLVLVATGIWFVRSDYLVWRSMPTLSEVGRSAIVLIFAFVGVEVALVPSGEIDEPSRTVPRALFLAFATTTSIYLLVQTVAQGLLGPALATHADAPLAAAASQVLGQAGRLFVIGGAAVSMFGYLSGDMLGSPRAYYALARDGILPMDLARIHPRYRTPYVAIVCYAVLVSIVAATSGFVQLAILANIAVLSLYLLCVGASYELRRRDVRTGQTAFNLPGGPIIPILATSVIVWLLSQATIREFAIEGLVLSAASLMYGARKLIQS